MFIRCEKITGFKCADRVIIIRDSKGLPFYTFKNVSGKTVWFNLPKGLYETDNTLTRTLPRKYHLPNLPKRERNYKLPERIKYVYAPNKNKCSIFFNAKPITVVMDNSFKSKPKPFRVFIRLHEIAHFFYSTEWKCDLFACKMMAKLGYNPSQFGSANTFCLSEGNQRATISKNYSKKVK